MIEEQTLAPDFELPNQSGKLVRLSKYRGSRAVVLFFYPKDDTAGCTIEACRFRDDIARFREAGAEIIGVSGDSPESHARFTAKFNLPFTLLSDPAGRVRKLYGVKKRFGVLPARVTFVIDRAGIVRHVFSSLSKAAQHVEQALTALAALPL